MRGGQPVPQVIPKISNQNYEIACLLKSVESPASGDNVNSSAPGATPVNNVNCQMFKNRRKGDIFALKYLIGS